MQAERNNSGTLPLSSPVVSYNKYSLRSSVSRASVFVPSKHDLRPLQNAPMGVTVL